MTTSSPTPAASRAISTAISVAALARALAYLSAVLTCAPVFYHLATGSKAFLGIFEDDYYYYATIADKVVGSGIVSYDGLTKTNGFHPLWLLVLVALRAVFGRFGTPFYVALGVVLFASMLASYELARRFAGRLGASPQAAAIVAASLSFGTDRLMCTAMECVVAVPLMFVLLEAAATDAPVTARRALKLGALSSLVILARLDAGLLVALLLTGWLVFARPSLATAARCLGAFATGGLLVVVYAAANWALFGSPVPVSAIAKQLQRAHALNATYVRMVASGTCYGAIAGPLVIAGAFAYVAGLRRPAARPAARVVSGCALLFTLVFYGLNASTGWIFFGWYAYPLTVATIVSACALIEEGGSHVPRMLVPVAAAAALAWGPFKAAVYFVRHGPLWSVADNSLLAMSFDLADHLRSRSGVFGMGAVAGMAAYVVDKPFVQLEGLVADRALLEHIRREDSLGDVLRSYGVDYLVVSYAYEDAPRRGACYVVTEPDVFWAGRQSLKMRGTICSPPVEHFVTRRGPHSWSMFPDVETFVFDVRTAVWSGDGAPGPES